MTVHGEQGDSGPREALGEAALADLEALARESYGGTAGGMRIMSAVGMLRDALAETARGSAEPPPLDIDDTDLAELIERESDGIGLASAHDLAIAVRQWIREKERMAHSSPAAREPGQPEGLSNAPAPWTTNGSVIRDANGDVVTGFTPGAMTRIVRAVNEREAGGAQSALWQPQWRAGYRAVNGKTVQVVEATITQEEWLAILEHRDPYDVGRRGPARATR